MRKLRGDKIEMLKILDSHKTVDRFKETKVLGDTNWISECIHF